MVQVNHNRTAITDGVEDGNVLLFMDSLPDGLLLANMCSILEIEIKAR